MKIFVISLPSATARQASIARQMKELKLDYSLIDGVKVNPAQLAGTGYSQSARLHRYGYGMAPGEIGCFLAHQAAWRAVQDQNEKCLILEDDAMVLGLSSALLASLRDMSYPVLRLAGTFEKKHKFIAETVFAKYWGDPSGSGAYILGPYQAKKLLEKSAIFYMAVDDFIEARHLHGLNTYAVLPYPVWQEGGEDTQISNRGRPQLSAMVRLRRMLLRIPVDISKYLHRLVYYYF